MTIALRILLLIILFAPAAVAHEGDHPHAETTDQTTNYAKAIAAGKELFTGSGEHLFRLDYEWLRNVDQSFHGPTHGSVVVDKAGLVYVSTDTEKGVFVLDGNGDLVRTLGPATQFLHAMVMTEEDGRQVIVAASPKQKKVLKLGLDGTVLLSIPNELTSEIDGGFNGVTSVCLLPRGEIVASCGYGSNKVHIFDADGRLLSTFGGRGKEEGTFNCCHGLAYDDRYGEPRLLVANREANRLDHYTLGGEFIGVHCDQLSRPCVAVLKDDVSYVAELNGRVTALDKDGQVLARLGENPNKQQQANFKLGKTDWQPGVFTAPHGLGFDGDGNLYVQDWNVKGRVTRLVPVRN